MITEESRVDWANIEGKLLAQWIREAFLHIHDVGWLASSPLVAHPVLGKCQLPGDGVHVAGHYVQALLHYGLEQLQGQGTARAEQSHHLLQRRYLDRISAGAYADEAQVSEWTAQTRRRAAVRRVAHIVKTAVVDPIASERCLALAIILRYQARPAAEQATLRFLALFRQPVPVLWVNGLLRALVDDNLVIVEPEEAVQIHATTRPFLLTQLTVSERLQYHQEAATHYAQQGQTLEAVYHYQQGNQPLMAAQLLLDSQNDGWSLTALSTCLAAFNKHDLPDTVWSRLQLLAGHAAEDAQALDKAMVAYESALSSPEPLIQAEASYQLGHLYGQRGNGALALTYYEACQQWLGEQRNELAVKVCIGLAWIYIEQLHNPAQAKAALQQATTWVQPEWLILRSDLHNAWGAYYNEQKTASAEAETHLGQAWLCAWQAKDQERSMHTAYNLGVIYNRNNKYSEALQFFQKSLALSQATDNGRLSALNNKGIGSSYVLGSQDFEAALPYYQEAFDYFETTGHSHLLGAVAYDLAEALAALGQTEAAQTYYKRALTLAEESANKRLEAALIQLGQRYVELTHDLNERQRQAMAHLRQHGSLTNQQYCQITGASPRTAVRDLHGLVQVGVCAAIGKGRGAVYRLNM